jgi:hypothetical protein
MSASAYEPKSCYSGLCLGESFLPARSERSRSTAIGQLWLLGTDISGLTVGEVGVPRVSAGRPSTSLLVLREVVALTGKEPDGGVD